MASPPAPATPSLLFYELKPTEQLGSFTRAPKIEDAAQEPVCCCLRPVSWKGDVPCDISGVATILHDDIKTQGERPRVSNRTVIDLFSSTIHNIVLSRSWMSAAPIAHYRIHLQRRRDYSDRRWWRINHSILAGRSRYLGDLHIYELFLWSSTCSMLRGYECL